MTDGTGDDDPSSSTWNGERSLDGFNLGRKAGESSADTGVGALLPPGVTGRRGMDGSGRQLVGKAGIGGGGGALLESAGADGQCCMPRPITAAGPFETVTLGGMGGAVAAEDAA
eukprot:CAMPEP_0178412320 /NCGR_PEP_ID=MMETSP0689_2-20121128/21956_1 /TAXON_ID=160604 /ORGANISM="Amphidinium massartii, Strain CS-259" /LENGTH=113 /DNA_ID=CAMNT_0020033567 /DNA_START=185 /DNA_END=527 /DNA_ORIENTATION=+